jgi:hypothetical protein
LTHRKDLKRELSFESIIQAETERPWQGDAGSGSTGSNVEFDIRRREVAAFVRAFSPSDASPKVAAKVPPRRRGKRAVHQSGIDVIGVIEEVSGDTGGTGIDLSVGDLPTREVLCTACPCCREVCSAECKKCRAKLATLPPLPAQRRGLFGRGKPLAPYTRCMVRRAKEAGVLLMVAHDEVYDATNFTKDHPAGVWPILKKAGEDATVDFDFHSKFAQANFWQPLKVGYVCRCPRDPVPQGNCHVM